MYSGITGEEFKADIYLGVVYYQRLRHMVNDKFQVRTTGPVDPLTRQPIKVRQVAKVYRTVAYFLHPGSKTSRWYPIR
jgi:DNA-directed RNA polymerase I subunit RPA2